MARDPITFPPPINQTTIREMKKETWRNPCHRYSLLEHFSKISLAPMAENQFPLAFNLAQNKTSCWARSITRYFTVCLTTHNQSSISMCHQPWTVAVFCTALRFIQKWLQIWLLNLGMTPNLGGRSCTCRQNSSLESVQKLKKVYIVTEITVWHSGYWKRLKGRIHCPLYNKAFR